MSQTVIGTGSPQAVKKFSALLAVDSARESYWQSRFMSAGPEAETPVQLLTDLEREQGEEITYDLSMQLRHEGVEGDNIADGKEEDLKFYTDSVKIDQLRVPMGTGGRMTKKRTKIDLMKSALARGKDWWSRRFDELFFTYAAGARGVNSDYGLPMNFTGRTNNPLVAPDAAHIVYGGLSTAQNTMVATDKMTAQLVRKAEARAQVLGGGITGIPGIAPCNIDGEKHYVMVMHTWQSYDMQQDTGAAGWIEINKSLTTAIGKSSPLFKGGLGMINNVILHSHKAVPMFNNYGSGANVSAARALMLGRQALICAFGDSGSKMRFDTVVETKDGGNRQIVFQGATFGVKKSAFVIDGVSRDFGLFSVDTAAAAS